MAITKEDFITEQLYYRVGLKKDAKYLYIKSLQSLYIHTEDRLILVSPVLSINDNGFFLNSFPLFGENVFIPFENLNLVNV
jgi:hypothetical protein